MLITRKASIRLEELLSWLENEWSVKVKYDFIEKFEKAVFLIQKFPEIAPKSKEIPNLHKYILSKQTSLYYRVDKKSITIITVFDNRMNPDKLQNLTTKKP